MRQAIESGGWGVWRAGGIVAACGGAAIAGSISKLGSSLTASCC